MANDLLQGWTHSDGLPGWQERHVDGAKLQITADGLRGRDERGWFCHMERPDGDGYMRRLTVQGVSQDLDTAARDAQAAIPYLAACLLALTAPPVEATPAATWGACPTCEGSGEVADAPCPTCGTAGRVTLHQGHADELQRAFGAQS